MKNDNFKTACRIYTDFLIHRYLQSNAEGRHDGYEKATRHTELCAFYVAIKHGVADVDSIPSRCHHEDFDAVHEATQALTSYLDQAIGFPIIGHPDYNDLVPKFFDKFHEIAVRVLGLD